MSKKDVSRGKCDFPSVTPPSLSSHIGRIDFYSFTQTFFSFSISAQSSFNMQHD